MTFPSKAALLRVRAAVQKNGVRLPNFDDGIEQLSWDKLHKASRAFLNAATEMRERVKDDADADELRSIERDFDTCMEAHDAIQAEMDLRRDHDTNEPLTEAQRNPLASMRPRGGDGTVNGANGAPVYIRSGWRDSEGREIRVLAPNEPLSRDRHEGPGIGDIARAMIYGPRDDAERRALAEGTGSAGGYTVPTPLSREFFDNVRAKSVVMRAGARTVEMTSSTLAFAKGASDPTVAWKAENAAITPSDPTFDRVLLTAKKLVAIVKVSRELLEDTVNLGQALNDMFVGAMATEMDRAALFGAGGDAPTGLYGISGINSILFGGANGGEPSNYDYLIDAIYEIQDANGNDPTALIWHPRTAATMAKLKDQQLNPLNVPDVVARIPKFATTSVPKNQVVGASDDSSTVLLGDFSKMLVGIRVAIELIRNDLLYMENDQVGFLARARMDVDVTNVEHFCRVIGINTNDPDLS